MKKNTQADRLKAKNKFMLFVLVGLCLMFYVLSIVKMKGY